MNKTYNSDGKKVRSRNINSVFSFFSQFWVYISTFFHHRIKKTKLFNLTILNFFSQLQVYISQIWLFCCSVFLSCIRKGSFKTHYSIFCIFCKFIFQVYISQFRLLFFDLLIINWQLPQDFLQFWVSQFGKNVWTMREKIFFYNFFYWTTHPSIYPS